MRAADFYTGLVAESYSPLKSFSEDSDVYAGFVREAGTPGLELGCGDGDPLIALRRSGLDVEGVDSSADMLERCRSRAAREGVSVTVHRQRMEELDLSRRFRSIFLAGPTFNLLPDDATVEAALRRIRAHLAHDGIALIPLHVPPPTPADQIGKVRTATAADGVELRVSVVAEERDENTRTRTSVLRYERLRDGESTVVERPWLLHWYSPSQFERFATAAGLATLSVTDADGNAAGDDAAYFTVRLKQA